MRTSLAVLAGVVSTHTCVCAHPHDAVQGQQDVYKLDTAWPQLPSYNISRITAVAVVNGTASKEIHVAQRNAAFPAVCVFAPNGTLLRTWGDNATISSIHGMQAQAGSPSTIWVTDVGDATVKQFDIRGNLLRLAGTRGIPGGGVDPVQFSAPADIAITPIGNVVVSDGDGGSNNRVLDLSGSSLDVFWGIGGAGNGPGQFSSPHSVAFEPAWERLWVADRGNSRIQVFLAASGLYIGEMTECLAGGVPWGVRIDSVRNRVLVADGTNGALYALNVTWGSSAYELGLCNLMQNISISVAATPHELAIDETTGDVYLAGVGTPATIQRYINTE